MAKIKGIDTGIIKLTVHRWPVMLSGPRGKVTARSARPLESRVLDARGGGMIVEVNFGMGDWVQFRLSDGQSKRAGLRDWVVDDTELATLKATAGAGKAKKKKVAA